ncbi:hypothetical protein, partial [Paraburkholderia sp. SIMBA_030]|uniref:hypothetical protein n=1 Tax=Paraburkholderia sp. SIMBA_030 TaxID=3085773 RepID=UPI00397D4CBB
FAHMATHGLSWQTIIADKTDYRALLRESHGQGNSKERIEYVSRQMAQQMVAQCVTIFDRAFKELDIGPALVTEEVATVIDME